MTQSPNSNGNVGVESVQALKALDKDRAVTGTVQQPPPGQSAFFHDATYGLFFMAYQDDEIEPWGRMIKARDRGLREFIPREPLFASALGIVCARNAAFSWKLEGPPDVTDRYQHVLQQAQFGGGWAEFITKVSVDLYTQDQGAFIELIREADNEYADVVGIAHLDAQRCFPTGIVEAPVVYLDRLGVYHVLKWYQVRQLLDMPATYEGIPGVQYCVLTRIMRACRIMRDISIYLQEKVGGRNARAVTLVKGVTPEQMEEAWNNAKLKHDSQGLMRFSQPVIVGSVDPKAEIGFETLELASLPDGFDLDLTNKQYIGQLAMGFGTDYQEFAPLPGGGLGTSTQSEVLHMKSRGKGPGLFMKMVAHIINWAVLPPGVEFQWDEQDPEEDKAVADVASVRGLDRKARIESGEITPTVARQLALQVGDLTQEMVDQLEEADEQAAAEAAVAPPVQPQAEQSTLEEGATPEGQTTPGEQATVDEAAQREWNEANQQRDADGKFAGTTGAGGGGHGGSSTGGAAAELSKEQQEALANYSENDYSRVNTSLRGGAVADSQVKAIDGAIASASPLASETTVYRAISPSLVSRGSDGKLQMISIREGSVIHDKAFVSTTRDKVVADRFAQSRGAVMEIKLPKGTRGLDMKEFGHPEESEFLMGRGASFRITGSRVEGGKTVFTAALE